VAQTTDTPGEGDCGFESRRERKLAWLNWHSNPVVAYSPALYLTKRLNEKIYTNSAAGGADNGYFRWESAAVRCGGRRFESCLGRKSV